MKECETPLKLVRLWPRMLPGCYEALDRCKAAKAEGEILWPDYCELPIGAAVTFLTEKAKDNPDLKDAPGNLGAELTACWAWRKKKIVYWFDGDLTEMLSEQAAAMGEEESLPTELLIHPPYPIVYIKAPLAEGFDGFFYWVEYDTNSKKTELRFQWVTDDMSTSIGQFLHINPNATINECLQDTAQVTKERIPNKAEFLEMAGSQSQKSLDELVEMAYATQLESNLKAIQLVLYLVSQNADIEKDQSRVGASKKKKRKQKSKSATDSPVTAYSVGVRVGAAIRKSKALATSGSTHDSSSKRPHSRRGHWHHYWTGPRDGERTLILKWVAPTYIHINALENDDTVTVYPVKE